MRSPKNFVLSSERRLLQKMSEVISLREKVAQAELDVGHLGASLNQNERPMRTTGATIPSRSAKSLPQRGR